MCQDSGDVIFAFDPHTEKCTKCGSVFHKYVRILFCVIFAFPSFAEKMKEAQQERSVFKITDRKGPRNVTR